MYSSTSTNRCLLIAMAIIAMAGSSSAQSYVELKEAMDETSVTEKKGNEIPLSARFQKLDGNWYELGEFFNEGRPVFLSLNYANCPQLCKNQLKTLAEKFNEAEMKPGRDFEFISVSLDPREAEKKTREAKSNFCRLLTGSSDPDGVHFLVGRKKHIDQVADAIGFTYVYVPAARHYSHAPLCVALTPDGRVSRYIHNLAFTAEDLKESATVASDGGIADESVASFVYRCLLFGVNPGQYTKDLLGLMKIAGAATVIIVGACVIPFWFRNPNSAPGDSQKKNPQSNLNSKGDTPAEIDAGMEPSSDRT